MRNWKKELDKIIKSKGKITLWDEISGFLEVLFRKPEPESRSDGYRLDILGDEN
jgi:hypothetical protein